MINIEKYFYGNNVSYNVEELKRQLNTKNIYLDEYIIDDKIEIFNIICANDLNISDINLKFIEHSGILLRGECNTKVSKDAYETILEIARVIKLNFLVANYEFVPSTEIPVGISKIKDYINDNVILIQFPINEEDSDFHSFYLYDEYLARPIIFINSNEYIDNQNFYIAHELYHHFTKDDNENKADSFAAKLLIPNSALKAFNMDKALESIIDIQNLTEAPYKAVVKALYNRNIIDKSVYTDLMGINPRDNSSKYAILAGDRFNTLNKKSNTRDVSSIVEKILLYNLTSGKIDIYDICKYVEVIYEESVSKVNSNTYNFKDTDKMNLV